MKMTWVFCLLPLVAAPVLAQDAPPGCTALVTIQSQGCSVRQVFTCASDTQPLRWVASHGPKGPISLTVLDLGGMPQVMMTGKDKPRGTLDASGDPAEIEKLMAGETDSFDYKLLFDDGTVLSTVGTMVSTGKIVKIDGRSLREFQRIETINFPNGSTSPEMDNLLLYDPELGLMLNTVSSERATGKVMMDRSPVDFLFPGEEGADSVIPLYGCEG